MFFCEWILNCLRRRACNEIWLHQIAFAAFGQKKQKSKQRYARGGMGVSWNFLVACTRLYTSLCRSVRRSVRPSVRPSVGRKSLRFASLFSAFRAERRSDLSYCPCPTTILPLPTRTRLMLPCIRPCSLLIFHVVWRVQIIFLHSILPFHITFWFHFINIMFLSDKGSNILFFGAAIIQLSKNFRIQRC